ncbi:MAG: hypothetical protein ACI8UO_000997 [Verrucomicrobiales bacterium]|jgi:hypothetical protein
MTYRKLRIAALIVATVIAGLHGGFGADVKLDVAAKLTQGPGGLAISNDAGIVVSLHPFFQTRERAIRIDSKGEWAPYPSVELGSGGVSGLSGIALDSVMAVHIDAEGIVWMLDSGRRGEATPKIVGWNPDTEREHRVIYLPKPITIDTSYLADFAIDPEEPFIYIADPAGGQDAALIVVDLTTGLSRRVLHGHLSVTPENISFAIGGKSVKARRVDGSGAEPMAGVNPIAIDQKGRNLYFGPLKGLRLYNVETEKLRDPSVPAAELNQAVEYYAVKPICDSIAIDEKNNIYAADLAHNAITIITPDERKPEIYIRDPRLCWPDGLSFGPEGRLYFFCSQLHRTESFNGGQNHTEAPFVVYRIKPFYQPFLSIPLPKNPFTEFDGSFNDRFGKQP